MQSVVVNNLPKAGAFSVVNKGADIELQRSVVVEKREKNGWTRTEADVRLIGSCTESETGATRLVRRGETLVVVPWNGWSCDGQCPRPCRANIYLGPGEFRFVVMSADRRQRFVGPPFRLGPEPKN